MQLIEHSFILSLDLDDNLSTIRETVESLLFKVLEFGSLFKSIIIYILKRITMILT